MVTAPVAPPTPTSPGLVGALARDLAGAGLDLRQANPRDPHHLLLTLARPDGSTVAGQWFADPSRAARVAAATATAAGDRWAVHRPLPTVLTQQQGADRRLPGLRPLLRGPDRVLVSHRPERRAVVRSGEPGQDRWTKVVRPDRAADLAARLALAHDAGVPCPGVVELDERSGTVTTEALPGRSLHESWQEGRLGVDPRAAGELAGRCLRRLHDLDPGGLPRHDAADELATTRRWLDLAQAFGVLGLPPLLADALLDRAASLLAGSGPGEAATVHRDLHDKQLVLAGDRIGLLDLDTLAGGDAAVDVANFLVHLELRVHQGLADERDAVRLADGFLTGHSPSPATQQAVAGYALTTRLRLCAVYAFRPGAAAPALALLGRPGLLTAS